MSLNFLAPNFFTVSNPIIVASYFASLLVKKKFILKDNTKSLLIGSIMTNPISLATLVEDPSK